MASISLACQYKGAKANKQGVFGLAGRIAERDDCREGDYQYGFPDSVAAKYLFVERRYYYAAG